MGVKIEGIGNTVTAYLEGEIDHHCAIDIREQIDSTIERLTPSVLYLDFGGVSFMDSSGIGLVMGRYRTMQLHGGKLVVTNINPHIKKIMRLAGLERLSVIEKGGKKNEGSK